MARIHFNIKLNPDHLPQFDLKEIEQKLIEVARSWTDDLQMLLLDAYGEEEANASLPSIKMHFLAHIAIIFHPEPPFMTLNTLKC